MLRLLEQQPVEDALTRATERVRDWLDRRLDDDAMDIARLYRTQRDRLVSRLRIVYDNFLGDEPTFLRARTSGAGIEIDRAISEHVDELARELYENAVGRIQVSLDMQPQVLNRNLSRWLGVEFRELPITTQEVLGELTTSVVGGGTYADRLFHVTDDLKRNIVSNVRQTLLNGEDFETLRDRMLRTFGVDRLAEPAGPAYGSVKIYKNEARRQWNLLMDDVAEEAEAVRVWWAIVEGAKARTTTPGCAARHGMRIDEDLDGETPPRHFNCRCTIGVFPLGIDLREFRAQGTEWLQERGYTRRSAMAQESGWAWGGDRLRPLLTVERRHFSGAKYAAVPRRNLPAVVTVQTPLDWHDTIEAAQAEGDPDSVVVRSADAGVEVLAWSGWKSLKTARQWIEVSRGLVADSPDVVRWETYARRLPLDLIERWPVLRTMTFPTLKPGEVYAARFVDEARARSLSLGFESEEWLANRDLNYLSRKLVSEGVMPGAYLALAIRIGVPDARGMIRIEPSQDVRTIVSLTTGGTVFAREPFDSGLVHPYTRVAIITPEQSGRVWAVRPRGEHFWALPGGHIEPDESPHAAACREMLEETGVRVEPIRLLGTLYRSWSTTLVYLARRVADAGSPTSLDEIDAVSVVSTSDLEPADRLFVERRMELITPHFAEAREYKRHAKGTRKGGQFAPKGVSPEVHAALRKRPEKPTVSIAQKAEPVFDGGAPIRTRKTLSKLETGDLAENLATAWLHSQGFKDARVFKPGGRNNYPVDIVSKRAGVVVEAKGGLVSVKIGARHWRTTIGEPSEVEKVKIAGMAREKLANYNGKKSRLIHRRKNAAMTEVGTAIGRKVKGFTIGTIINPDTKTADMYRFDGFHASIPWHGKRSLRKMRKNYIGTFRYTAREAVAWEVPYGFARLVEAWEAKKPTLEDLSPFYRDFWLSTGMIDPERPDPDLVTAIVAFSKDLEAETRRWIKGMIEILGGKQSEEQR